MVGTVSVTPVLISSVYANIETRAASLVTAPISVVEKIRRDCCKCFVTPTKATAHRIPYTLDN